MNALQFVSLALVILGSTFLGGLVAHYGSPVPLANAFFPFFTVAIGMALGASTAPEKED